MSPAMLRVGVIHAETAEREALCDFIADEVGADVVGGTPAGPGALDGTRMAALHVLLVDLDSVGSAAADVVASARAASPRTGILLLVSGHPRAQIDALLAHGVGGYLEAARAGADLAAALRTIGMGRRYLPA